MLFATRNISKLKVNPITKAIPNQICASIFVLFLLSCIRKLTIKASIISEPRHFLQTAKYSKRIAINNIYSYYYITAAIVRLRTLFIHH